jgi:hypothetical protein
VENDSVQNEQGRSVEWIGATAAGAATAVATMQASIGTRSSHWKTHRAKNQAKKVLSVSRNHFDLLLHCMFNVCSIR